MFSRTRSSRLPPHTPASLQPFLDRQGTVILDGGFGTALGAESEKHALWGAQHLFSLEGHNRLLDIHRTFLEAGSDVICSGSYQVSFEILSAACTFTDGTLPGGNITLEKNQLRYSNDVLRTSVELAKKARDDFWTATSSGSSVGRLRPLVAASVGPAGDNVALWTGTTDPTTAVYDLPDEVVSLYYRRKLLALCRAKPDLLALETLPGLREARLALSALSDVALELAKLSIAVPPVWVSLICTSETATAAGDDLGRVVAALSEEEAVVAVGVNCVAPSHVEPLLKVAKAHLSPGTLLLAYPNSGEVWDSRRERRCWHGVEGEAVLDGSHALGMQRAGADGIGGCCRVTAEQIRTFREALVVTAAPEVGTKPTVQRGGGDAPRLPGDPMDALPSAQGRPSWFSVGVVVCCIVGVAVCLPASSNSKANRTPE